MKRLPEREYFSEQDILDKLRSPGITRRKAEEQLFKKYAYFMNVGVHKYSLSEDDLSDAYSDTILAGIESITNSSFREKSSIKTFLFQIFQNKCVDILRKKSTHRNRVHQTIEIGKKQMHLSDPSQSVLEKLIVKTETETLKQQFRKLGDKWQRLLFLSAEGYTDKEIATEMNFKTRDVAKISRLRCINTLRKWKVAC